MIVSAECYKIFASILNDFGHERVVFTYADFTEAVKAIGFGTRPQGILIPPSSVGHQVFRIDQDKMKRRVSPYVQDKWKCELFKLYGWTAETFRC